VEKSEKEVMAEVEVEVRGTTMAGYFFPVSSQESHS
jgi:hypothetical protein